MMNGMGWGGMWFGSVFWLVILGLIVWAVISMVNKNRGYTQNSGASQQESALECNAHCAGRKGEKSWKKKLVM